MHQGQGDARAVLLQQGADPLVVIGRDHQDKGIIRGEKGGCRSHGMGEDRSPLQWEVLLGQRGPHADPPTGGDDDKGCASHR